VHLLPCNPPTGQLEPAPRTALRADSAQERWEGYWGVADEAYYARSVRTDGTDQWYRLADEGSALADRGARILPLRRPGASRSNVSRMAVFSRAGERTILVGTSRRRAHARRDAERSR